MAIFPSLCKRGLGFSLKMVPLYHNRALDITLHSTISLPCPKDSNASPVHAAASQGCCEDTRIRGNRAGGALDGLDPGRG